MRRKTGAGGGTALVGSEALLADDAAVFGFSYAAETPPDWIDDDAEVGRRICAKRGDPIGADLWWRVAEIAQICRRLSRVSDAARDDLGNVGRALEVSLDVAQELPWPLPAACALPDPLAEPLSVVATAGPRRDLVDAAAHRLASALDDPGWVDPDALAGWVDDAVLALRAYGLGLIALRR